MKEQVIELAKQAGFQKFLKPADTKGVAVILRNLKEPTP